MIISPVPTEQPTGYKRRGYRARMALKAVGLEASIAARRFTGQRMRPKVFIIGAQKAGTTSLFGHLARHPQFLAPMVKEVHYFDVASHRPESWYRAQFATAAEAMRREDATGLSVSTFDTTPYYIFHPDAAARIAAYAPDARIIALLRNPVDRAWSHYWHEWARGFENLGPTAALNAEHQRLPEPHSTIGDRYAHQHYSYVSRSEYECQMQRWLAHFPEKQILCLKSETLFSDPTAALGKIATFLEVAPFDTGTAKTLNAGEYDSPPPEIREWLEARLDSSMRATTALLGDELSWR